MSACVCAFRRYNERKIIGSCVSSDSESEDDYAFVSGHYMEDVDEINWARGSKHSRSIQRGKDHSI